MKQETDTQKSKSEVERTKKPVLASHPEEKESEPKDNASYGSAGSDPASAAEMLSDHFDPAFDFDETDKDAAGGNKGLCRKKKLIIALAILLAVLGTLAFVYFKFIRKSSNEAVVAPTIDTVTADTIRIDYTADGLVKIPFKFLDFENSAEITSILINENDSFAAGDLLATQDITDYEEAVKQTENDYKKAQLALKAANYNEAENAQNEKESKIELAFKISSQKLAISDLELGIQKLQGALKLMEQFPDEYASVDVAAKKNELLSTENQLDNAKTSLSLYEQQQNLGTAPSNSVEEAQFNLEDAQKALEEAKDTLASANLYAPKGGKAMQILFDAGDTTGGDIGSKSTSSSFITYIADEDKYEVTANIPDFDLQSVYVGQTVEAVIESFSDEPVEGVVTHISNIPAVGNTVTYTATIELDSKDEGIRDSMSAVLYFIMKKVDDVLTLPNSAVCFEDKKQYVDVLNDDGTTEKREITTGFSDGTMCEITSGLSAGERVSEPVKGTSE